MIQEKYKMFEWAFKLSSLFVSICVFIFTIHMLAFLVLWTVESFTSIVNALDPIMVNLFIIGYYAVPALAFLKTMQILGEVWRNIEDAKYHRDKKDNPLDNLDQS